MKFRLATLPLVICTSLLILSTMSLTRLSFALDVPVENAEITKAFSSSSVSSKPVKPNILFIFTDDHAYQSIGCYGSVINQTPNIDRLAREGVRFDRCYVTNSICGPMRAVIQTGKYSHLNGFCCNGNKFDGTQQTFPKLLQTAGYQTAVVGKWHLGTHMAPQGYDYSEVLVGQGPYYNPPMLKNGEKTKHVGYTTDIITDLAIDWLKEKRDKDKPFMLMYQHKAPHRNWQPGPKHLTMYDDQTIPEPATLFDSYEGRGKPAHTQDMSIEKTMTAKDLKLVPPQNLTPEQLKVWNEAYEPKNKTFKEANLQGKDLIRWKYQRYIKDYLRCIASVDDNIGRMLQYLDDNGLKENTIVIYCSDQGFYLGEHGWFDKRWMYEESLRTPFIVRWPGVVKPGTVNSSDIVSPLDFAETFCEVAGVEVPNDMQGQSLVPVLKGQTPEDWRKVFYYHYYEYPGAHSVRRHYGVTDGQYKLMRFYEPDVDEWEMYDLASDPNELKSIHADANSSGERARLMAELSRLRSELKVPEEDPPASIRKPRPKKNQKKKAG
jgi:arylsulfatase A-like enzyme